MARHYIISTSNLIDTFSRVLSGKEFDFTLSTSESSFSDSNISKDDFLLVSIEDIVYCQFKVIDKTEEEIRLKKVFEIEKSVGYTGDQVGTIKEIDKKDFDFICSKLFDHLIIENHSLEETPFDPTIYVKEQYIGRFVFEVLTFLNELDELNSIKPFFKVNDKPNLTSIKTEKISLTSIFRTSENELSKEKLAYDDGKPRFFKDVIFYWKEKNYYLSTEWTANKESRLDLENFKLLIEKYYPKFSVYEEKGNFLFSDKIQDKAKIEQEDFDISEFQNYCKNAGLIYSDSLITRFIGSLITKPFVILTGLSGSGKTKLAQAFVQWICQNESQYRIIPVGADWTNREPLLGYPNALDSEKYVKPDSGVIDLILQANSQPEIPHFLILDEMNLSHVERYFADFLSVMESDEEIPLFADGTEKNGVPSKLKVPTNLFIIGTVNIDETTNMFSPKVLDRANTIEFRINNSEMKSFLSEANELLMDVISTKGAKMAESFVSLSNNNSFTTKDKNEINKILLNFFGELQKTGAEFGYRSASEILRLINQLDTLNNALTTSEKLDFAIMQKLLPKLHGSRRKLSPILEALGSFCLIDGSKVVNDVFRNDDFDYSSKQVLYPLSLEKISRMYKGAIDNGFASYAEA